MISFLSWVIEIWMIVILFFPWHKPISDISILLNWIMQHQHRWSQRKQHEGAVQKLKSWEAGGLISSSVSQVPQDEDWVFIYFPSIADNYWIRHLEDVAKSNWLNIFRFLFSTFVTDLVAVWSRLADWHKSMGHAEGHRLSLAVLFFFLGQWFAYLFPIHKMNWGHKMHW